MTIPFLIDTRRLTGRTILLDGPGAVLETRPPAELKTLLGARWRREVRRFSVAMGWGDIQCVTRWFAPTLHCALAAPIDQLLLATHIAEWAWELALSGVIEHEVPRRAHIRARLRQRRDSAANPTLVAFRERALKENAQLLIGDGDLSVGEGKQALTFDNADAPDADSIDWPSERHRIPIALITGTNGKTTTTRLLARMASSAGRITGHCCTDSVEVGGEVLASRLWEERRLAYPIKGQRKGAYWITYFRLPTGALKDLTRQCEIHDGILRQLFVRLPGALVEPILEHAKSGGVVRVTPVADDIVEVEEEVVAT